MQTFFFHLKIKWDFKLHLFDSFLFFTSGKHTWCVVMQRKKNNLKKKRPKKTFFFFNFYNLKKGKDISILWSAYSVIHIIYLIIQAVKHYMNCIYIDSLITLWFLLVKYKSLQSNIYYNCIIVKQLVSPSQSLM